MEGALWGDGVAPLVLRGGGALPVLGGGCGEGGGGDGA